MSFLPNFRTRDKNRSTITVLGTTGSGKTTVQQLIMLQAISRMTKDPKFAAHIVEKSIGAVESVSNLYAGKFPPKTETNRIFEAVLEMREDSILNAKECSLNFIDISGENATRLIAHLSKGIQNVSPRMFEEADLINKNLIRADSLLLVLSVPRTAIVGPKGFLEEEPENLPQQADVNANRFVEAFYYLKRRQGSIKLRKLGVIFTKADLLHTPLAASGFNISTHEGRMRFLVKFYPLTFSALGWFDKGFKVTQFWPSYVELQYDAQTKLPLEWPVEEGGGYKIMVEDYSPVFSDDVYDDIIKWALE